MNFQEYFNEQITEEMEKWFESRTKRHIKLVGKYCERIKESFFPYAGIDERARTHDASKFKDPERKPYVYISWNYKCKAEGIDYTPPKNIKEKMLEASNHHVLNNSHHPEMHSPETESVINPNDRDKPPDKMIDATSMKDLDIAEMCADWAAMSEELGKNTPQEWAKSNINVRWKFTEKQVKTIYNLLNSIWDEK